LSLLLITPLQLLILRMSVARGGLVQNVLVTMILSSGCIATPSMFISS
jgi:hypothetical protein